MEEKNKKWKICIKEEFLNCEYVYPIQQRKVKELIDYLKENPNVEKIIIFGSSVTERCTIDSDVDIYIQLSQKCKRLINKFFNFPFDMWTNYSVDDRLLKEINEKGVIVYEKSNING